MHAIESLVPGFDHALERMPGAAPAWRVLTHAVDEAPLSGRQAALANLAVAQKAGGDYARWVMGRLASKQGLNAEDIFLATAGTGRGAPDAAIVKAAAMMASQGNFRDTAAYRDLTVMPGAGKASAMLPQVALGLLACDVLEATTPGRQARAPSRKGARP